MTSVWDAGEVAISELNKLGYTGACFVGGVACSLYGNTRSPKDLDILILDTSHDQESIKRRLVASNSSFYLISSKKPGATYKVLWYDKYPRSLYLALDKATFTSIKVDILLPGIMDIPSFPNQHITRLRPSLRTITLPTAPLALVLLLKLQAWSQHRAAPEYHYSKEQYKDSRDLDCLVPIAAQKGIKPKSATYLPASFISTAETRVQEFLRVYPSSSTRSGWITMGFKVPSRASSTTARVTAASSTSYTSTSTNLLDAFENLNLGNSERRRPLIKPISGVKPLYSFGGSRY